MVQEKYKPYPKYKPSGVEWIGEIPAEWENRIFKRVIAKIKDGTHGSFERTAQGRPLLSAKNVSFGGIQIEDDESLISEEDHYGIIRNGFPKKGDLLLTIVGTIGRAWIYDKDYPLSFQRSVAFLRLKANALPQYYYYLVQSQPITDQFYNNAKVSAQSGLYMTDVSKLDIILAPLLEQQVIADFLDRETKRINNLVEKQTRRIELLKEKRSALITHAVTKGLDPKVKMKDSGVEWIGEIPEGWEVRRLRFSVKYNLQTLSENTTDPNYEIEYLDISNVDGDGNIISTETLLFRDAPSRARRVVKNSNNIISTVRTYLKAIAYLDKIPSNLIVSTGFAVIESVELTNSKYLFYFLRSEYFVQNVTKNSKGVSYPAITPSQSPANLIDILILVPPLPQQQIIADFLDRETAKIDTLIGKIEKQIELLNEYKQSLITDAVTGKIDVRGEANAQNP